MQHYHRNINVNFIMYWQKNNMSFRLDFGCDVMLRVYSCIDLFLTALSSNNQQLLKLIIIITQSMGEYCENIDFSDVFSCLNFEKQIESSHFCFSPSKDIEEWYKNGENSSQMKEKQQNRTQDKKTSNQSNKAYLHSLNEETNPKEPQFHQNVISQYKIIRQGTKDDTVKLHINFKTILVSYFKEMIKANELSPHEQKKVLQYSKRPPSFKSFIDLIFKKTENNEQSSINHLCTQLIESTDIVKSILCSKCQISTKLQMIKFLQILRKNLKGNGTIVKWKTIDKRNQKFIALDQPQQQTGNLLN